MIRALALAVLCAACAATIDEKDVARAQIHYDIAVAQLNEGNMRGALRELLAAVELDPTLAVAHNALGLVYHSMGRLDDALTHYEKAVTLNPKFSEAHNNLGVLLIDLGRYDEAIGGFQTALGDILYPTPSLAEGNMGWAYYKKGDAPVAQKHLRNAVATSPKFCRGYLWLARIALDKDEPADAIDEARRFGKQCVADRNVAAEVPDEYEREMGYYLGLGLLKQGDRDAAREAFAACSLVDAEGFGRKCADSLAQLR
jgi:type IV pilus assembly protein PilF